LVIPYLLCSIPIDDINPFFLTSIVPENGASRRTSRHNPIDKSQEYGFIMMTVQNLAFWLEASLRLQQDFGPEEDIAIFLSVAIEDCDI